MKKTKIEKLNDKLFSMENNQTNLISEIQPFVE